MKETMAPTTTPITNRLTNLKSHLRHHLTRTRHRLTAALLAPFRLTTIIEGIRPSPDTLPPPTTRALPLPPTSTSTFIPPPPPTTPRGPPPPYIHALETIAEEDEDDELRSLVAAALADEGLELVEDEDEFERGMQEMLIPVEIKVRTEYEGNARVRVVEVRVADEMREGWRVVEEERRRIREEEEVCWRMSGMGMVGVREEDGEGVRIE